MEVTAPCVHSREPEGVNQIYIGNYKTQAPVSKQLSPAFVGLIEQVLKKLISQMSTNTNQQENEFIATLRFGSGDNIKTLKWYGSAIERDLFYTHS